MTTDEIRNFIIRYTNEVWNKHNVRAMNEFYSPTYIHHDVSAPEVHTLQDYSNWATGLLSGLSNFRVVIDDLIAEPGKAVKCWTATGFHENSFAGVPPTNKQLSFSGVSIYRLENDKIAESWYMYDMFGLLQQLGAISTNAEAEAPVF